VASEICGTLFSGDWYVRISGDRMRRVSADVYIADDAAAVSSGAGRTWQKLTEIIFQHLCQPSFLDTLWYFLTPVMFLDTL
jgi:hypothetical protein